MARKLKNPTKLLFISHSESLDGGGEVSLFELLKSAKSRGYDTHLVVPSQGVLYSLAQNQGIRCHVVNYYRWWSASLPAENVENLSAVPKIAEILSNNNIDCVITNTVMTPWGALAAAAVDKPHVWTIREFLTHERSSLQGHYKFVNAYSNLVIANSKSNAKYLRETGGIPQTKYFYSYVDVSNIKLQKNKGKPRIISIGIIHPDKNQFELLMAIAEMKKMNELSIDKLFFIGRYRNDNYFKKLKLFIKENKLDKLVEFKGYIEQPYTLVHDGDILVQPSKQESLGRTITESMKLGLICVGADISGTKEAFDLGGGNLYKSGDVQDLKSLLVKIIRNPKHYKKLAEIGKKQALKNMSEQACHQPFFNAVNGVLGQQNPRSEMQYIRPQFNALLPYVKASQEAHQIAQRRKLDIENIINSKSWKAVLTFRSVKTAPKKFLRSIQNKKDIHFVYLPKKQFYGSSIMRVNQLADIAKRHTSPRNISISPLDSDFKGCILFLSKWALEGLNTKALDALKKRANLLIFDPVDAFLPSEKAEYADIIIAASLTALDDYSKQFPRKNVLLVNHHTDPRIAEVDWTKRTKELHIGYFGELVNTIISPEIEKRVDFIRVDTSKQEDNWLHKLPFYNMHYAIRQVERMDYHKPFLKGFTAAHCDSNIVIQDSQEEAIHWLGKDYPYLIKGNVTEAKIIEKLDEIKTSYGSSEWRKAHEVMLDIKNKTSESAIGKQLEELFSQI